MIAELAKAMLQGVGIAHPCHDPRLIETHASWLVLLGDFAYKLKKPVDLQFLDYSTLEKRKYYCEEELRLNRRTAPDIYIDVLPISGDARAPRVGDPAAPFEYVIRMHRFDEDALLHRIAARDQLNEGIVDALARAVARFHDEAAAAPPDSPFATPKMVRAPADDNFLVLQDRITAPRARRLLERIAAWSERHYAQCASDFRYRHDHGYVRECHGDLHLGNILYRDGRCTLFDCIEFSEQLRWIDVAADIAFTIMDMDSHGKPALAHMLLNEYLQRRGDYGCLAVLDYYRVYRALVRAKVAAIRADQEDGAAEASHRETDHYLQLADTLAAGRRPFLVLMSGLSGTGKTWVARRLAARNGAIHLRSDVERKRLYGLDPDQDSHAAGLDIYTTTASVATFDRLAQLAGEVTSRGYGVVVDAVFIGRGLRQRFEALAVERSLPWAIVACTAPGEVVRRRLAERTGDASEAGYAQYLDQQAHVEPFDAAERRHLIRVDTTLPVAVDTLSDRLMASMHPRHGRD